MNAIEGDSGEQRVAAEGAVVVLDGVLGEDQPIYAFQARGLEGEAEPFYAVEAMEAQDASLFEDPTGGWARHVARPIALYEVGGNHSDMLRQPRVSGRARPARRAGDAAREHRDRRAG